MIFKEPDTDVSVVNRDPAYLYDPFRLQIEALLKTCQEQGLNLYIFEARRTFARQDFLYTSGRSGKPGKILTNASGGLSSHQWGCATDLVFDAKPLVPGIQWTWNGSYQKMGEIIKSSFPLLNWAGTWQKFKEYPHIELRTKYSPTQLKAEFDRFKAGGTFEEAIDKVTKLYKDAV